MTRKALEKMYKSYGISGRSLKTLVDRALADEARMTEVFEKTLKECQAEIDSANKMKKAEKILKKKKRKA